MVLSAILVPDSGDGGIHTFYAPHLRTCRSSSKHSIAVDANPFKVDLSKRTEHFLPLPPDLWRYLTVAGQAYSRALATRADIIELCDWPLAFVPAIIEQRVPYVVQCHGSMGQIAEHDPQEAAELQEAFVQLIEPQLLRCAHRIQTSTYANQRFWEQATGRSVGVIRPAFPLPPLPVAIAVDNAGRVFGRLQRWKGPHILCEALRLLGQTSPHIEWYGNVKPWASGDWPADRRLAADFPSVWGTKFKHSPGIPRDQVFKLQASALFNVVPSTWDVFNFTAAESMAAARPTIVSTGAGASELIVDGENGFTFESGNAGALAAVIDRVLSVPESRRREIGAAGRETIRIELDPARIGEQRIIAYEEAIHSFHAAPPQLPHDWLIDLLSSQHGGPASFDALLDPVPLRAMAQHAGRRIRNKFRRGAKL